MKKEGKKWMLVVLALLAVITGVLPLVGCKNDSVAEPATHTVTFNSNGGTGTMNPQSFTAGMEQELAANAFERKNYTFVGWSEDSEATSATYGDKAKFTAIKDTTLYAVWEPLCLTFTSDSSTALITTFNNIDVPTGMEYSTDGREWSKFTNPQQEIQFGNGTKLYLRGKSSTGTATSINDYVNFTFTESTEVSASGDIRTLVDWNDPVNADTSNVRFCNLFKNCTQLVTAPELPATRLADLCYRSMFSGCRGLKTAPTELPAKKLAESCYSYMFYGCTSLKTAPELPATTLAERCYNYMFSDCTGLTTAPTELPAMTLTLAESCYNHMFSGCTSLETAPELPATTLAEACYMGMFSGCRGLKTAPELPAETLATDCYYMMFDGCTNLASVTMLATNVSASYALGDWLRGTAENGTLTVASGMEKNEKIKNSLPSGKNWTVVAKTN